MARVYADLTAKEKAIIGLLNGLIYDKQLATLSIQDDSITFDYESLTMVFYRADNSVTINGVRVH